MHCEPCRSWLKFVLRQTGIRFSDLNMEFWRSSCDPAIDFACRSPDDEVVFSSNLSATATRHNNSASFASSIGYLFYFVNPYNEMPKDPHEVKHYFDMVITFTHIWLVVYCTIVYMLEIQNTLKPSNFAPHGNFGPIFAKSVLSLDEFCTNKKRLHIESFSTTLYLFPFSVKRNRRTRFVALKFFYNFYSLYFCRTCFNDSKPF
jgi:hypothetical protein